MLVLPTSHEGSAPADVGRRRLLAGLASLPLLSLAGPAAASANADLAGVTLRVTSMKGDDSSFLRQAGVLDTPYHLQRTQFAQAAQTIEALNAGACDLGLVSSISPLFLPERTPIRLAGLVEYVPSSFRVYVPKGSPIRTPADLRGKRIGYMRAGPLHLLLLEVLRAEGMGLADVQASALSAQDSSAAFVSGHLDAVLVGLYAAIWQVENAGGRVLVSGERYPVFAESNATSFAVHARSLEDPRKRQAIADYLQRFERTWAWIGANADTWARDLAKLYGTSPEFIARNRTRQMRVRVLGNKEGLARINRAASAFADAGLITRRSLDHLWDPTLESMLPRASASV